MSFAWGVSADGSVVVGASANANSEHRAFRWENNLMQNLGTLGGTDSEARGISADGSVVVGSSLINNNSEYRAFRWQNNSMQNLGTLGGNFSAAQAASSDGSIVVGTSNDNSNLPLAFRWQNSVMEDLNVVYASLITSGSILREASAISPDGRFITGYGFNSITGRNEAYLLDTIPEPASLLALGSGLAAVLARRRRGA